MKEENPNNPAELQLNISIGTATAKEGMSLMDVFRQADQLMYAEKNVRKDQTK